MEWRNPANVTDRGLWTPGSASTASCARCCTSAGARRRGHRSGPSSRRRSRWRVRFGAQGGSTDRHGRASVRLSGAPPLRRSGRRCL